MQYTNISHPLNMPVSTFMLSRKFPLPFFAPYNFMLIRHNLQSLLMDKDVDWAFQPRLQSSKSRPKPCNLHATNPTLG